VVTARVAMWPACSPTQLEVLHGRALLMPPKMLVEPGQIQAQVWNSQRGYEQSQWMCTRAAQLESGQSLSQGWHTLLCLAS